MYTYNLFKLPHSSVHEALKLDILTTLNTHCLGKTWLTKEPSKWDICFPFGVWTLLYLGYYIYIYWLYILSSYSFIIQLTFWRRYYMIWKTRYAEHVKSWVNCVAQHSHVRTQMLQHHGHVKAFSRLGSEKISLPSWSKCKCRRICRKFPV